MEESTSTQIIKISSDILFTYFKTFNTEQKEYLNKHFQLDGTTTVEALKGLHNIACDNWKPKIESNHPEIFEKKVWKRELLNKNSERYYYLLTRNCKKGLVVSPNYMSETNLNYTFVTEEEAENNALLYNTIILMRNWAKFHNELDGFKANWNDNNLKYGISIIDNKIGIDYNRNYNSLLFHISVSSRKRAEEMLSEFKEDLEKLISLGMFN